MLSPSPDAPAAPASGALEALLAAREPWPLRERLALAGEILGAYARVRLLLWRSDLPAALSVLRSPRRRALPTAGGEFGAYVMGVRLGNAVIRLLRALPTDGRCLMRSLVLTALLARRGIAATLVIAVRPEPDFAAHAWLEHARGPLLPAAEPGYERLHAI